MSREMGPKEDPIVYVVAILIVVALVALFGYWAFSWSTHTLVWLNFMGLSLAGWGNTINRKR